MPIKYTRQDDNNNEGRVSESVCGVGGRTDGKNSERERVEGCGGV